MKIHEVATNDVDKVERELAALLHVEVRNVWVKFSTIHTTRNQVNVVRPKAQVTFRIPEDADAAHVIFLAKMFKKCIQKVLPAYSEFQYELPILIYSQNGTPGGTVGGMTSIFCDRGAWEWEREVRDLLSMVAASDCKLSHIVRIPS